jgi:hypothetical protein
MKGIKRRVKSLVGWLEVQIRSIQKPLKIIRFKSLRIKKKKKTLFKSLTVKNARVMKMHAA